MAETILNFLQTLTDKNEIIVLLVSMFPLIELKGAIPIATGLGLSLPLSALLAYVGSTFVFIPVFFLLIPIFNLLKKINFIKVFIEKIERVFYDKANKITQKTNGDSQTEARKIMMISLFIFVAVPFPVTGVWTGTAIAVFLGLKFKEAVLPIALGNLVAGLIITLLTWIFSAYVDYIISALLVIAVIMLIVFIVKIARAKPKND